jgi:hypothetical protein
MAPIMKKLVDAVPGKQDSLSSYYILGYYTTHQQMDDKFREVKITGTLGAMAKLNYRAGYTARSRTRASVDTGKGGDRDAAAETAPVLLYKKEPEYSEEARKAKWQGTVLLLVEVDASGQAAKHQGDSRLGHGTGSESYRSHRTVEV